MILAAIEGTLGIGACIGAAIAAIGAGIGGNLSMLFGIHTIWISSALLSISVLLMFAEKLKI